jgi:uroporphyrin-III C-methyltransferase
MNHDEHSTGRCTLVGAGPGDPELLTLKAVKAIQQATVLLVDDLVSDEVLAYASPTARIVHVGKRGGCKSTPQAFIEKLMISAARDGERVVRLKGGDPFIFGRGGEEVEHLRAAGIAVDVVNGITSGLAAVTSLGVPLTHRDHAHGVVFVTGHARPDGQRMDWKALAATARDARLTLVIYMGVSGAHRIQQDLLTGLGAQTPVAVIQNASLATQRQALTTLGELSDKINHEDMHSPAVIVVGDVVRGVQQLAGGDSADQNPREVDEHVAKGNAAPAMRRKTSGLAR